MFHFENSINYVDTIHIVQQGEKDDFSSEVVFCETSDSGWSIQPKHEKPSSYELNTTLHTIAKILTIFDFHKTKN